MLHQKSFILVSPLILWIVIVISVFFWNYYLLTQDSFSLPDSYNTSFLFLSYTINLMTGKTCDPTINRGTESLKDFFLLVYNLFLLHYMVVSLRSRFHGDQDLLFCSYNNSFNNRSMLVRSFLAVDIFLLISRFVKAVLYGLILLKTEDW